MNWTRNKPAEPGLYLYRYDVNPAIDKKNIDYIYYVYEGCVLMKVDYYKELQMGIPNHLVAKPQLPYTSTSTPVFDVDDMDGEWREYKDYDFGEDAHGTLRGDGSSKSISVQP